MLYEWHETVSADTAEADRTQREVEPGGEVLKAVELVFPDGCADLARARLFQGGFQVFPVNAGGHSRGNGAVVHANLHYDMARNAGPWYFETWNLDDTYEHTLTLRMETFERAELLLRLDPASYLDLFRRLFGRFKKG